MNKGEFSASRINTYKTCPRLFYYQYEERAEEPRHVLTLMGSALHKAIEYFYTDGKDPQATFNREFFNQVSYAQGTLLGIKGKDSPVQVAVLGRSIIEAMDWSLKPVALEQSFSLPFPNKENPVCTMRGIIDMIIGDDVIIDHKSSKVKPSKKKLAENYQFSIYAWAYREMYGKLPSVVYWHHLRTQELIEADVLTDLDARIEQITEDVKTIIADEQYDKIEKNGFCTNVCHFHDRCWGENNVENNR